MRMLLTRFWDRSYKQVMNDGLNLIRFISFLDLPHGANLAEGSPAPYLSQSSFFERDAVNARARRNDPSWVMD